MNPEIPPFLRGLRRESGAFADTLDGEGGLRSTFSVRKALAEAGDAGDDPRAAAYAEACYVAAAGGFSAKPGGDAAAYETAVGLVMLHMHGRTERLAEVTPGAIAFMRDHAATQFDHFMLVASFEECGLAEPVPATTVAFFEGQLAQSLPAGRVLDTAIAAASLLRAAQALPDPAAVVALMRGAQDPVTGGFGEGGKVSLFATYCAMRLLVLLRELPDTRRLLAYLDSLATDLGYTDAPGGHTSAGATYMALSMLGWVRLQQAIPVAAARDGDVARLRSWLASGGAPDVPDDDGWTALAAAAARGHADAVGLLLHPDIDGAAPADPSVRYAPADALPVYLAAQAGDTATVALLLGARPDHLHGISAVNGHTPLLQASFYGKARHLELAAYLLDQAAEISGLTADALRDEQARLLAATNVRGYDALGMQDLWHNQAMKDLLLRYYDGVADGPRAADIEARRVVYLRRLLLSIATPQALTERLMAQITAYLAAADPSVADATIDEILAQPAFDINRIGGDLDMPPLIFAITGTDVGDPARAARRHALAEKLLRAGADPAVRERHPMAVGAVIRASVLNNFGLLQLIADHMTPEAFRAEMNVSPAVNGLTAMHDAIHRALTSPPEELDGHLAQIRWMIARGASLDVLDNTGQTQRALVAAAADDPAFPASNVAAVTAAVVGA